MRKFLLAALLVAASITETLAETSPASTVATWMVTPSSANLAAAITDETGSGGALVFASSPTIATPTLSSLTTGTNADTLCLSAGGVVLIQAAACTISSMRFKDLRGYYASGALSTLARLDPIVFTMKPGEKPNPDRNYGREQIGLSAENVAAIEPRCAIYEDDGVTPKSYRQECLIAVLVAGMKEQRAEIVALKARLR